jgi:hypothetical protein
MLLQTPATVVVATDNPYTMAGIDRSFTSTFAHFSQGFGSATAGTAEHDFYGIPLSNNLATALPSELMALGILLAAILLKPLFLRRKVQERRDYFNMAFWTMILTVTWTFRQLTLVPLLTSIIYTRTSYPYLVVLPHCIVSAAVYRSEREQRSNKTRTTTVTTTPTPPFHWLSSFGLAFLCFGFGGSIVSDVLMGLPVTALGHNRILPCYILGWLLVWYSPFDIVFQWYSDKTSFVYFVLTAFEAVDAVTTPMGRISRGARELKNWTTAPILGGVLAGTGGAAIRYVERVVIQGVDAVETKASVTALENGVYRTLGYSIVWWWLAVQQCHVEHAWVDPIENHCPEYSGSDAVRVLLVLSYVIWVLLCEVRWVSGHPFIWFFRSFLLGTVGATIVKVFHLGPARPPIGWNGIDDVVDLHPPEKEEKVVKKD